jgi:hypothetical protein
MPDNIIHFPRSAPPRPLYASWEYWRGVEDTHRTRLEANGVAPDRAREIVRKAVDETLERLIDDRAARRALCDAGYMPVSEYVGPEAS